MKWLWSVLLSFSRLHGKYLGLKDTEEGNKAVGFGVAGIVYALITAATLVVCYFAFKMTFADDWSMILGFILLVVGAAAAALCFLHGLYSTLLQFKLNGKAIAFLSLFFQIAAFAGAIVVVLAANNISIL